MGCFLIGGIVLLDSLVVERRGGELPPRERDTIKGLSPVSVVASKALGPTSRPCAHAA